MKLRRIMPNFLFVCSAITVAAQPYNWTDSPPPLEEFAPILQRVWTAALEDEPFKSIRSKIDLDDHSWMAEEVLPGAESCNIAKTGIEAPTWEYKCELHADFGKAENAYTTLTKLVEASRNDWRIDASSPYRFFVTRGGTRYFHSKQEGWFDKQHAQRSIQVSWVSLPDHYESGVVEIVVKPLKPLFPPGSGPYNSEIDKEIGSVRGAVGQCSSFPEQQQTVGISSVTILAFTNRNTVRLRVLMHGETEGQYDIAPNSTVEVAVPPGNYEILANVATAGRPFCSSRSYQAGSIYSYEF